MNQNAKMKFSGLAINIDDIPKITVVPPEKSGGGEIFFQSAYGLFMSFAIATRKPGYHSIPHRHKSEQLNILLEGEAWLFCDDEGYKASAGDVIRVPPDVLHWAWVTGDSDSVLLEAHSPPLIGDELLVDKAVSLLKPEETTEEIEKIKVEWPEVEEFAKEVEKKYGLHDD